MKRALVFVLAAMLAAAPATAQQQTLYLAGYSGNIDPVMRQQILPAFEKSHGVKVEYVAGTSTDNLARLQAQRNNQQIDAYLADDGPVTEAIRQGLCRPVGDLPKNLLPIARFKSGKAVGIGIGIMGLMYSKKYFADKGWPAPTSWNDLKNQKYRKAVVLTPLSGNFMLYTFLMLARLNGGSDKNVDPAFAVMKNDVDPNVVTYEAAPGQITAMFQSGQAALTTYPASRAKIFADTGYPVGFVYPKEGALPYLASVCPIDKPNASPLALELIKYLLTPDVQKLLVKEVGYLPVIPGITVSADEAAFIRADAKLAAPVDWEYVNAHRDAWNDRWNHDIAH